MMILSILFVLSCICQPSYGGVVVCAIGTNVGCSNGGICYNASVGLICSCKYGWTPPTCATPMPLRPICDPRFPNITWPACQYCDPAKRPYPQGNGCYNFGTCSVKPLSAINPAAAARAPPGTELPICGCVNGWVPPMCSTSVYTFFQKDYVYPIKYLYMSVFIMLFGVSVVFMVLHLMPSGAGSQKRTRFQKQQMIGLLLAMISALFMSLWWGMNTFGIQQGGYNLGWVLVQNFLIFIAIALHVADIALITGAWISIAFVSARRIKGVPWLSKWLGLVVGIIFVGLAIACSVALPYGYDIFRWFYLSCGIAIFIMGTFILISGLRVIIANRAIKADGKSKERTMRQARMASQLILVAVISILALIVLNVLVFLPPSSFSSFDPYYFATVMFPIIVQSIFLSVLIWLFRRTDLSTVKWRRITSSAITKSDQANSEGSRGVQDTPQVDAFAEDVHHQSESSESNITSSVTAINGWDPVPSKGSLMEVDL